MWQKVGGIDTTHKFRALIILYNFWLPSLGSASKWIIKYAQMEEHN
jgi:hypothetical protein